MSKPSISFGFSKNKPKTSLVQTPAKSAFSEPKDSKEKIELITSIEGKKVNKVDDGSASSTKPQQVIIALEPNRQIIKKKNDEEKLKGTGANSSSKSSDDLEAVRALMKDSAIRKESSNNNQEKIELKNTKDTSDRLENIGKDLDNIEEANYEAVDIDHFGKVIY